MGASVTGYSMPIFWWGLLADHVRFGALGLTPVSGRIDLIKYYFEPVTGFMLIDARCPIRKAPFSTRFIISILPAIVLGTVPLAVIARMTRSSMLEVLSEDYVRTARAKGLSPFRVVGLHALRNALMPVVTVIGLSVGALLSGAVLTETIFSWPGVGKWLIESIITARLSGAAGRRHADLDRGHPRQPHRRRALRRHQSENSPCPVASPSLRLARPRSGRMAIAKLLSRGDRSAGRDQHRRQPAVQRRSSILAAGAMPQAMTAIPEILSVEAPRERAAELAAFWSVYRENRGAVIGLWVLAFIVVCAIFANVIAPHSPIEQFRDAVRAPPIWAGGDWKFALGADGLGRDILSRLIYGARISLFIGLAVMGLSSAIGVALGLAAAYFGGFVDVAISRLTDVIWALPSLVLAVLVIAIIGPSLFNTIIAITIVYMPSFVRLMRASAIAELAKDYVTAARVAGVGPLRLMVATVLPNCLAPYTSRRRSASPAPSWRRPDSVSSASALSRRRRNGARCWRMLASSFAPIPGSSLCPDWPS